jgi:hypothetical protein
MSAGSVGIFVNSAAVPVVVSVLSLDHLPVGSCVEVYCSFCCAGSNYLGCFVEGKTELRLKNRGALTKN